MNCVTYYEQHFTNWGLWRYMYVKIINRLNMKSKSAVLMVVVKLLECCATNRPKQFHVTQFADAVIVLWLTFIFEPTKNCKVGSQNDKSTKIFLPTIYSFFFVVFLIKKENICQGWSRRKKQNACIRWKNATPTRHVLVPKHQAPSIP